ncbi:putative membrane protein [Helicobacter pylori Hp H-11]|nr:putative membrane protein [Helicobacter pylori Hp H-11]
MYLAVFNQWLMVRIYFLMMRFIFNDAFYFNNALYFMKCFI